MKRARILISIFTIFSIVLTACGQEKKDKVEKIADTTPQKEMSLEMSKDTLDAKIAEEMEVKVLESKVKLTEEALTAVEETYSLLEVVKNEDIEKAIKKGEALTGKLEILLAEDPDLALIPINVDYHKDELVSDIESVRKTTKLAQEAMDDGYYQLAGDLLENLRSEMVVNTYLLPTATYPLAIKDAVLLLKDNKPKEAEAILTNVLATIVIEKSIVPIPILNAEQMIIEASNIDNKDHENVDQVLNLLRNADYQLSLAEEMGYGKRDKEYKSLAKSIEQLKKSVENKDNSGSKFDSLKKDLLKFKDRLFFR